MNQEKDVQQELMDRVDLLLNYEKGHSLRTPIQARDFGFTSIAIEPYTSIDRFDMELLLGEFDYVHYLHGNIVISNLH